jgi:hypothetical protein
MTKTERNQLIWALVGAQETLLALTDGKGRARSQAKLDSPIVADRLAACLTILRNETN